jgi:hypothetical protein
MLPPIITRLLSTVLAMILLAASTVCLLEVSAGWLGNNAVVLGPNFAEQLRMRTWDDKSTIAVLAAVAAAGAVTLTVGFWATKKLTVKSASLDSVHLERRSLEQALTRRLERLDGVDQVRVGATSKVVKVHLSSTRQHDRNSIAELVAAEVTHWTRRYSIKPAVKVSLASPNRKA